MTPKEIRDAVDELVLHSENGMIDKNLIRKFATNLRDHADEIEPGAIPNTPRIEKGEKIMTPKEMRMDARILDGCGNVLRRYDQGVSDSKCQIVAARLRRHAESVERSSSEPSCGNCMKLAQAEAQGKTHCEDRDCLDVHDGNPGWISRDETVPHIPRVPPIPPGKIKRPKKWCRFQIQDSQWHLRWGCNFLGKIDQCIFEESDLTSCINGRTIPHTEGGRYCPEYLPEPVPPPERVLPNIFNDANVTISVSDANSVGFMEIKQRIVDVYGIHVDGVRYPHDSFPFTAFGVWDIEVFFGKNRATVKVWIVKEGN